MQVSFPVLDQVGEVCLDEDIDGQALTWSSCQGKIELLDHLASSAVCTKEVFCADLVFFIGDFVQEGCSDGAALRIFREREELRIEPRLKALPDCVTDENGFQ